jgi:hypothetical protein
MRLGARLHLDTGSSTPFKNGTLYPRALGLNMARSTQFKNQTFRLPNFSFLVFSCWDVS